MYALLLRYFLSFFGFAAAFAFGDFFSTTGGVGWPRPYVSRSAALTHKRALVSPAIFTRVLFARISVSIWLFETVVRISGDARLAANWVRVELLGTLNRASLTATAATLAATALTAEALGTLILRINDGLISGKIAKTALAGSTRSFT
jgi:hypothetical protein